MSTTLYLIQAQHLLELALDQARQERDRGVFEMARGERSLKQLQRLVERVALVQGLWQQVRSLLGAQEQPPAPTRFPRGHRRASRPAAVRSMGGLGHRGSWSKALRASATRETRKTRPRSGVAGASWKREPRERGMTGKGNGRDDRI